MTMICHRLTTWSHDDNRPVSEARNTNCSCEVKEVKIKLSVLPRFLLFYGLLPLLSLSWSFFTSLISFSQELQSLWSSTGCYCSNTASWKHTHMHCTWAACKCIDSYTYTIIETLKSHKWPKTISVYYQTIQKCPKVMRMCF